VKEIDPTQSTDPRVARKMFLGTAAAAAAGTAAFGSAFAETELGKPHLPLVPEDDPTISVQHVQLQTQAGAIPAYAATPRTATAATPGVVVVMHIWGVDTSIRDIVRRLAEAGFNAIAPDLFGRMSAPRGDGATDFSLFRPFAQELARDQTANDLRSAAEWLKAQHPGAKLGVLGFCMGGAIALRQTADNPTIFAAVAAFYGNIAGIDPAAVAIPVVGSYGERDTSIPADAVRAFSKSLHVPNDIVEYSGAGHAFMDDQRSSYVPDAAQDAWRRTVAFLTKYLKA
jgi:carboxymethylenebutenolidase